MTKEQREDIIDQLTGATITAVHYEPEDAGRGTPPYWVIEVGDSEFSLRFMSELQGG